MKKYLLPPGGQFYKANLHCHSTLSDGHLTPEELKAEYKSRGYSVLAYTDHDIMLPHHDLADETFLPLTGYEMEVNEEKDAPFSDLRTCHMCLIALEPDRKQQVCWHREDYLFANAVKYRENVCFDESQPDYVRHYTPEGISDMMKRGRENGFFVTWNHPAWSFEESKDYLRYENMNAMEICNYGCVTEGFLDYCPAVYDEMLRAGKRIYCIGTDDNHNWGKTEDGSWDSGGAWTMIKAEKLDYRTITQALEDGHFYASQGPEIHEMWIEDDRLHIITSDAVKITLSTAARRVKNVRANLGETINCAVFDLNKDEILERGTYLRITVVDADGKCANSNAYFLDTL